MAITREQAEQITKAIEAIIGEDCPIMVSFDEQSDIHVIVFSGENGLPINIYMSHAIMLLSSQHAMQAMNRYKEWLLRQAQHSGQVLPTAKETM